MANARQNIDKPGGGEEVSVRRSLPEAGRPIEKIAVLTMDSLFSTLYLEDYLAVHHRQVRLIMVSDYYGNGQFQGMVRKVWRTYRRSGFGLANYYAFVCLYHRPALLLMNLINRLWRRPRRFRSIYQMGRDYGIPVQQVSCINDKAVEDHLRDLAPDLIQLTYFDQILRENIFSIPPMGCVNFHPGVLPDFRGPAASFWAMKRRGTSGLTLHYIDDTIDTGEILAIEEIGKGEQTSVLGMDYEIFRRAAGVTRKVYAAIESGEVEPRLQGQRQIYDSFPDRQAIRESGLRLVTLRDFIRFFRFRGPDRE